MISQEGERTISCRCSFLRRLCISQRNGKVDPEFDVYLIARSGSFSFSLNSLT